MVWEFDADGTPRLNDLTDAPMMIKDTTGTPISTVKYNSPLQASKYLDYHKDMIGTHQQ